MLGAKSGQFDPFVGDDFEVVKPPPPADLSPDDLEVPISTEEVLAQLERVKSELSKTQTRLQAAKAQKARLEKEFDQNTHILHDAGVSYVNNRTKESQLHDQLRQLAAKTDNSEFQALCASLNVGEDFSLVDMDAL